jgi:hypothetical protein
MRTPLGLSIAWTTLPGPRNRAVWRRTHGLSSANSLAATAGEEGGDSVGSHHDDLVDHLVVVMASVIARL